VKDRTWDILREQGAIIEEAADDDDDTEEEGEPQSFDEKVLALGTPLAAVNLVPYSAPFSPGTWHGVEQFSMTFLASM